jgi:hypothetical protein
MRKLDYTHVACIYFLLMGSFIAIMFYCAMRTERECDNSCPNKLGMIGINGCMCIKPMGER